MEYGTKGLPAELHLLKPGQRGEEFFVFSQLDDAVTEQGGFLEFQVFGGFSHLLLGEILISSFHYSLDSVME